MALKRTVHLFCTTCGAQRVHTNPDGRLYVRACKCPQPPGPPSPPRFFDPRTMNLVDNTPDTFSFALKNRRRLLRILERAARSLGWFFPETPEEVQRAEDEPMREQREREDER